MSSQNNEKNYAVWLFIVVVFLLCGFVYAQHVNAQDIVIPSISAIDQKVFSSNLLPYYIPYKISKENIYKVVTSVNTFLVSSFEFNDSGTCIYTSNNMITCGSFQIYINNTEVKKTDIKKPYDI